MENKEKIGYRIYGHRFLVLFLLTFINVHVFSQDSIPGMLESRTWIMCGFNLVDSATLTDEEKVECRHQFIFFNNGEIKYSDLLTSYDPFGSGGCSNSFKNYTGSWELKEGKTFVILNYNAYSESPYIIYNCYIEYISSTELQLVPIYENEE